MFLCNHVRSDVCQRDSVELPIDGDEMEAFIAELTEKYGGKKTLGANEAGTGVDMSSSFGRRS